MRFLYDDIWLRPWSRKWLTKQTWDDAVCIDVCMLPGGERERGGGERGGEGCGGRGEVLGFPGSSLLMVLIRIGLSSAAHERLIKSG